MKKYLPLIVVVLICILGAFAMLFRFANRSMTTLMINFAALFFLFLSCLKFWDIKGFVDGFAKYDLLTKKFKPYGFVYPFLELAVSLFYFSGFFIIGISIFTVLLMIFGAAGVFLAVCRKEDLTCGCMGTKLNLPLSVVSIVENIGMGAMAMFVIVDFYKKGF